jgi:hypothetical protein
MDFLCTGYMLADVAAIIGSLDIVFGEIDRQVRDHAASTATPATGFSAAINQ